MSGRDSSGGGSRTYDLVVVGGGTAGLVSAFIAATIGARVALIERARTGGDCLWTGCVPSKALIATARLAHRMRNADALGLPPVDPEIDFAAVMARVHATIATIEPADSPERLRAAGVEVIEGHGSFRDARTIEVDGRALRFRSAIVATGSEPVAPPIEGLEATASDVSTTDSIWEVRELPRRLAVLGGGPTGCELAQTFRRLGSEVTLVELGERLLPNEEPDASALIAARLDAEGVDVRLGTRAVRMTRDGDGAELQLEGPDGPASLPFDRLLLATGRAPRTAGVGLDRAGIGLDPRGAVAVDERLRTSATGIYAAGDVTARMPFTHVAAHHARVATVNALFGTRRRIDETIPSVVFTDPEVARIGLTVEAARDRWGDRARVARYDYAKLDRAITDGEAYGFTTLIADPRGRLVGATVAAPGGGEAIAELTARVRAGAKIDSVSETVHAYPTLAEGPARAVDDLLVERYAGPRWRRLAGLGAALPADRRGDPRPVSAAGAGDLTEGERWAREQLDLLRVARFRPRSLGAFLVASQRRAGEVRRARPELARQSRIWIGAGGVAWIGLAATGREPFHGHLASGLGWWAAVGVMLDWHLGMIETEDGEPRPLGPADALTLGRAWLVAGRRGRRRPRAAVDRGRHRRPRWPRRPGHAADQGGPGPRGPRRCEPARRSAAGRCPHQAAARLGGHARADPPRRRVRLLLRDLLRPIRGARPRRHRGRSTARAGAGSRARRRRERTAAARGRDRRGRLDREPRRARRRDAIALRDGRPTDAPSGNRTNLGVRRPSSYGFQGRRRATTQSDG